jgi:hypothetical protein
MLFKFVAALLMQYSCNIRRIKHVEMSNMDDFAPGNGISALCLEYLHGPVQLYIHASRLSSEAFLPSHRAACPPSQPGQGMKNQSSNSPAMPPLNETTNNETRE